MQLAYPIVQILFYLAMLFAPPEVDRISITGPDQAFEMTRTSGEWKFTGQEVTGTALAKDGTMEITGNGQKTAVSVAEFVKAAIGHDWTKQPKVTLQDQNTLEKSADGFVLRTDDGKPGIKEYRITFHRPVEKIRVISINVLGAVNQPGVYEVAEGSGVPAAVSNAGGLTEKVDRITCRILRGQGGTVPEVIEVPWESILNPSAEGPKLKDHDTVYLQTRKVGSTDREAAKTLQFRWVAAQGDAESPADVLPDPNDPLGKQTLRVLREVVLDHVDIEHAEVTKPAGRPAGPQTNFEETGPPVLRVSFSEAGAEKIAAATKAMAGRQLAIIWMDHVISAPRIMTPITGRSMDITSYLTNVEISELRDALNPIHINIAADGTLTVADKPCPADQLAERLGKLANKDAVSVVVHAEKKASFQQAEAILNACKVAGIKESALKIETP